MNTLELLRRTDSNIDDTLNEHLKNHCTDMTDQEYEDVLREMSTHDTDETLKSIIASLKRIKATNPSLRVGQIISNAAQEYYYGDGYYITDEELADQLAHYIKHERTTHTTENASPRPWRVNETGKGIENDDLLYIALCMTARRGEDTARANAALIVRAVNSYDRMREALANALDIINRTIDDGYLFGADLMDDAMASRDSITELLED